MPAFLLPLVAGAARAGAGAAARGATTSAGAEAGGVFSTSTATKFGQAGLQAAGRGRMMQHGEEKAPQQGPADPMANVSSTYSALLQGGQFG